jgi:hypothetical protein
LIETVVMVVVAVVVVSGTEVLLVDLDLDLDLAMVHQTTFEVTSEVITVEEEVSRREQSSHDNLDSTVSLDPTYNAFCSLSLSYAQGIAMTSALHIYKGVGLHPTMIVMDRVVAPTDHLAVAGVVLHLLGAAESAVAVMRAPLECLFWCAILRRTFRLRICKAPLVGSAKFVTSTFHETTILSSPRVLRSLNMPRRRWLEKLVRKWTDLMSRDASWK